MMGCFRRDLRSKSSFLRRRSRLSVGGSSTTSIPIWCRRREQSTRVVSGLKVRSLHLIVGDTCGRRERMAAPGAHLGTALHETEPRVRSVSDPHRTQGAELGPALRDCREPGWVRHDAASRGRWLLHSASAEARPRRPRQAAATRNLSARASPGRRARGAGQSVAPVRAGANGFTRHSASCIITRTSHLGAQLVWPCAQNKRGPHSQRLREGWDAPRPPASGHPISAPTRLGDAPRARRLPNAPTRGHASVLSKFSENLPSTVPFARELGRRLGPAPRSAACAPQRSGASAARLRRACTPRS